MCARIAAMLVLYYPINHLAVAARTTMLVVVFSRIFSSFSLFIFRVFIFNSYYSTFVYVFLTVVVVVIVNVACCMFALLQTLRK